MAYKSIVIRGRAATQCTRRSRTHIHTRRGSAQTQLIHQLNGEKVLIAPGKLNIIFVHIVLSVLSYVVV